ncbi:MAG: FKBP-type peptidyl-prolyl cis-trans isomerase [Luteibaculaceae bacterium]
MGVKVNDKVRVHYKGTLESGETFDSSEGRDPLEFVVGAGMVIPGFDNGVLEMEINETKSIFINQQDAYGAVDENLIMQVPKEHLPEEINPEKGQQLISVQPDGAEIPLLIVDVADDHITVDANHPLAGKNLNFEVTLVSINE